MKPGDIAAPIAMLAGVAVACWRRNATYCAATGLVLQVVRIFAERGHWTPTGRFGLGNAITLLRLLLVVALAPAASRLPPWAVVAALLLALALDIVDGRIARARGEASAFGATFDMETDALLIMMQSLLLWQEGLAGAWVLVAGLWRYVYAIIVAVIAAVSVATGVATGAPTDAATDTANGAATGRAPREAPRSQLARVVFAVVALSLTASFLCSPALAPMLALPATVALSFSFMRSLFYVLS
jgi:phosphatidylglycerophosphate synthase